MLNGFGDNSDFLDFRLKSSNINHKITIDILNSHWPHFLLRLKVEMALNDYIVVKAVNWATFYCRGNRTLLIKLCKNGKAGTYILRFELPVSIWVFETYVRNSFQGVIFYDLIKVYKIT